MERNENNEVFSYSYSAKEQEEIKKIRKKYITNDPQRQEDKMERLRILDASTTKKGTIASLVIGIIGALILGTGMSLAMTDIGSFLGNDTLALIIGILIGVLGIILVALAYPLYNLITAKERKRIAPEILRLSDELMK
ncbi:MAG: hypothetical protein J6D23_04185 [Clostridia bacterium]|nr:hypothetical protein [Clostridia bacterium]